MLYIQIRTKSDKIWKANGFSFQSANKIWFLPIMQSLHAVLTKHMRRVSSCFNI